MKLEELLAMLPVSIADIDEFDLQYLGLGEWMLHCWTRATSPTSGRVNHVVYKTPRPDNDPNGKRWDTAPRGAVLDFQKLNAHLRAVRKVVG